MRRTFSRRRVTTAKRPTQWVSQSNVWTGDAVAAYAANTLVTSTIVGTGASQLTTGGDTYLMAQRFTVLRVVGQFALLNNSAIVNPWSAGIIVLDEAAGITQSMDITAVSNADKSWLWMDHGMMQANGAGNADNTDMNGHGRVDVRVKRIMRPDQQLVFVWKSADAGFIQINLRALVARVA